jgi:pimeloyl-ACP methyl ester carboxylesterase
MAARLDARAGDSEHGPQPATSTDHYVEAGGLKLHYLDYGGPAHSPMLCLHGGAAHAHWWDFVASALSAEHHVIAPDHRGHGDSQWAVPPDYGYQRFAADVAEVVEKLDLRDFTLVGHSMGGMISLVYAATRPSRMRRLVIIDSALRMNRERLAQFREFGARPVATYPTREALLERYRLRPAGTEAGPDIIRHLAEYGIRQADDGGWQYKFDRNVYGSRKWVDGMACWETINVPVLLVRAELSDRITPELFAEVKARCPQVELASVASSRHHVMLDNPAGLVSAIQGFLSS